jgi:histidinol-phosphate aminotransferase
MSSLPIHPLARPIISKLTMPGPVAKHLFEPRWAIDLSNNTNPYVEGFALYPDVNQDDLKNLYLDRLMSLDPSQEKLSLTPENLLFTVGSMEGIDILLRTFCEVNQDRICVVHPTFGAYEHWGLIHNLEVHKVSLTGDSLNQFSIEEVVDLNPKMVFIPNPNNPVGTTLEEGLIEKLCTSLEGFVVVDEAYIEFSQKPSSLFKLNQYKNLIILRTFSKAWGLAGVRCGIILADELVIHSLRYVQLPYGFSSPTQALVKESLSHPERMLESWKKLTRDREKLLEELSLLPIVKKIFKSDTNFIFFVVEDSQKVMQKLHDYNISIFDGSRSVPHGLRMSLGTEEQNQLFLKALKEVERE